MANFLYRITSNNKGIYNAIREQLNPYEWHDFLKSNLTNWLPNPGKDLYENYDCITLFTEEGFKKFNKIIIPIIQGFMPVTVNLVQDTNKNLLYSDKYQKVFSRKDL